MPYSQFTLAKVKKDFGLRIIEGVRFFPDIVTPVAPSDRLKSALEDLTWAIAVGSEKAKSEGIIYPILQEVRRHYNAQISLFSGQDFTVDEPRGLSGYVDFLISRSPEQLEIEAPVLIIGEAKRDSLNSGLGQCIAEMYAAQQFNQANQTSVSTVYGCITNATQWRFLQIEDQTVTIDLSDYPLPPVESILGFLMWIVEQSRS